MLAFHSPFRLDSTTGILDQLRESLLRGLGKPEIRKAMLDAGWTENQIGNVMDAYADVPLRWQPIYSEKSAS